MTVKGVDISEMNGSVDFGKLKAAGVQFVIIRCGYGSDYTNQDDECFAENVRKADAAGMPWGVYLYSYAKNTSMAKSEAAHTLRLLAGRKPAYGVWYDVEDPQQASADLVSICEAYCKTVEASGCYCGIYSMLSWLTGKLNNPRLDRYDKWVAQWNSTCEYQKPYGIWQYTDCWSIGGKNFDGNWAYKDYPALTGTKKNADTQQKEDDDVVTYKQLKDVPASYQPTIRKLMKKGALVGRKDPNPNSLEDNILDVDEIYCRVMTTLDRMGLLDGQGQNVMMPGA